MFVRLLVAASLAAATFSALPAAAETIGSNDGGNCYPFACNDGAAAFDFYQIYDAGAFSGPLSFDTITFFGADGYPAPEILAGTYDISFGTTTDPVGSGVPLSLANVALFYSGALGGANLSIVGASYSYAPGGGNLVMHIQVSDQAPTTNDPDFISYMAADYTGSEVSRTGRAIYADDSQTFDVTGAGALVTDFSTTGGAAVPEPATWGLMLIGFGAAGSLLRANRRRLVVTA